jgi:lipoyl synthase
MKPAWLNKKINLKDCSALQQTLRDLRLDTVCEQAICPNIAECFLHRQATFLILGRRCTRTCSFCNIDKANPLAVDKDEPDRVAQAVARLCLKHVVITSVTRDDLSDGGAGVFADTVLRIFQKSPKVTIEVLIPDFKLSQAALRIVVGSMPQIIAHNLETVPSLYNAVRQGADYSGSLSVLGMIKEMSPETKTKSGIMLGLGEKTEEVYSVMQDLRSVGCDFLSIGQYLAPSLRHYPVRDYIHPEQFDDYKAKGLELGFLHIESGPYVRSSYMAAGYLSRELVTNEK